MLEPLGPGLRCGHANYPLLGGEDQKVVVRWALSWLKLYALEDTRYQPFLKWCPVLESAPRYAYIP